MEKFVSLDPGLKGALVFWREGKPERFELMPVIGNQIDVRALRDLVAGWDKLILEKVGGLPGQGAAAAFQFGRGVGSIYAVAILQGLVVIEVTPQKWQSVAQAGLPKAMAPKDRSRLAAERLYPSFGVVPPRCRVAHDGVCDALGIGHYYRTQR